MCIRDSSMHSAAARGHGNFEKSLKIGKNEWNPFYNIYDKAFWKKIDLSSKSLRNRAFSVGNSKIFQKKLQKV